MPYIKKVNRTSVTRKMPMTVGELNWAISSTIKEYVDRNGKNYTTFNDIIGVLECAKLEIYRRIIAPYEDKKIKENGDIF